MPKTPLFIDKLQSYEKSLVVFAHLLTVHKKRFNECNVTKRSSVPTWERQECGGDKHRARDLRDADTDARIARVPSGDNLQGYTFVSWWSAARYKDN